MSAAVKTSRSCDTITFYGTTAFLCHIFERKLPWSTAELGMVSIFCSDVSTRNDNRQTRVSGAVRYKCIAGLSWLLRPLHGVDTEVFNSLPVFQCRGNGIVAWYSVFGVTFPSYSPKIVRTHDEGILLHMQRVQTKMKSMRGDPLFSGQPRRCLLSCPDRRPMRGTFEKSESEQF